MDTNLQENSTTQAEETVAAPDDAGIIADAQKAARRRRTRKRVVRIAIVLLIAATVFVFIRSRQAQREAQGAADGYMEYTVGRMNIVETLGGAGTLQPADSYTVTSLIEGEILQSDFSEGDTVEKDELLFVIDSSGRSSGIERAQLTLSQAETNYRRKLENQEKLSVKAPGAGVVITLDVEEGDSVTVNQKLASIVDRYVMTVTLPFMAAEARNFTIGQSAVVSLDETYETVPGTVTKISATDEVLPGNIIVRQVTIEVANPGAITESQTASATVGSASCAASGAFANKGAFTVTTEAAGKVARIHIAEGDAVSKDQLVITLSSDTLGDEIQNAQNSVRDAELALQSQYDQLDSYTVTSPINGTVIEKNLKEGDTLSTGKTLCTIYDLSYLTFTMNIDELDIMKIELGQSVSVTADAVEGRTFDGTVTKISVRGTTSGGVTSYPVTVRIDETDSLLPGMNVNATIIVKSAENVLAIPVSAVSRAGRVLVKSSGASEQQRAMPDGATGRPDMRNMPDGATGRPDMGNIPDGATGMPEMSGGASGGGYTRGGLPAQDAPEGYDYVTVTMGISDDNFVEIISGLSEGDVVYYQPPSQNSGTGMMTFSPMGFGGQTPARMTRSEPMPPMGG